jgi:hypothetical protein
MSQEIEKTIDPLAESEHYLVVIAFGKSASNSYPLAVSVAQSASKYAETTIGKQVLHLAAFSKDKDGASKALAIMKYLGGSKNLQIFCKGTIERNAWQVGTILECFLKASACKDYAAHCRFVIDDPFAEQRSMGLRFTINLSESKDKPKPIEIHRYLFPCSYLKSYFRFQKGHPSKIEDQIQAAAINHYCEWCPYFDAEAFKALPKKIVMPDGSGIIEQ